MRLILRALLVCCALLAGCDLKKLLECPNSGPMSCPSGCKLMSRPDGHDELCTYTRRYCACPTSSVDGGTRQFSAEGARIDLSLQTEESAPDMGSGDIENTEFAE
jgi:hypothetical protein